MSDTDPVAVRRAKRQRQAGRPALLAGAILGAVAQAACAFVLGLGIGALVEVLRHSVTDSVFDDRVPYPTYWGPATMGILLAVGSIGLVIAAGITWKLVDLYRGGDKRPALLAPLGLCAVAAGVTVDAQTWIEPLKVGTKVDPAFHHDKQWSVFGWIAYYADTWLPALVIVIAALVVGYAIRHNRRLKQQIADRNRLLAEGRRVQGEITDVTIRTSQNDQGQRTIVGADIVVKFTDPRGTDRWVTRRSEDRSAMPGTGYAEVLFDPLRPGDDDSIFVAFHRDPAPRDWIGTAG